MAREVDPDRIEAAKTRLRALPEKPKAPRTYSLSQAIGQIKNEVRAALKRGYTFDEIAQALKEDGIDVGTPTLKSYVSRGNKKRSPAKTPPPKNAQLPVAETASKTTEASKATTTSAPRTGSKAVEMPAEL